MIAPRLTIAAFEDPADDTPPAPAAICWTVKELAAALGLAVRTVRKMNSSGKLPRPVRFGRAVRWRVAEIQSWLAAGAPSRDRWEAKR
jgi:excisionase family DNA binding protein